MVKVFFAENKQHGFAMLLRVIFELPKGDSKEAGPDRMEDEDRSQNKAGQRWKISRADEPW